MPSYRVLFSKLFYHEQDLNISKAWIVEGEFRWAMELHFWCQQGELSPRLKTKWLVKFNYGVFNMWFETNLAFYLYLWSIKTIFSTINKRVSLFQMLLRRTISLLARPRGHGKEISCCRSYLTDGSPVIGSEPDRFYF